MAGIDNDIQVVVTGDSPPLPAVAFGSLAVVCSGLGGGFSERIRYYEDAASADADADLTSSAKAAVAACFAQPLSISRIGIARVGLVAQASTIEITTAADGTWEVDLVRPDGTAVNATYAASGSATASAIAAGLRAALTTALGSSGGVTVGGSGAEITLTVAVAGDNDVTGIDVTAPGLGASTVTEDTAGVTLADELAAIFSEDGTWYAMHLESRNATLILRAAAFAESYKRFFVAQSSQSTILSATAGNLAETLSDLGYAHTALCYHATDSQWMALAWACFFLQSNPDTNATIASHKTLSGVTAGDYTSGQLTNLDSQNCNYYTTMKSRGVTARGVMANGLKWDQRLGRDWLKARCEEAIAQRLINASNANSKVPFTAQGLEQFRALIADVANRGVNAGHYTNDPAPVATTIAPAGADKVNRQARYRLVATEAGGVEKVTLTAYVGV